MPDTAGMLTSSSTRSGTSSTMRSTASSPSLHSPTTSMSRSSSRTRRTPRRNSACGSAKRTRIGDSAPVEVISWMSRTRAPHSSAACLDETEATVAPAIDHGAAAGVGEGEEEEVVTEQLHLQCGLLDAHRLDVELLALHDDSAPRGAISRGAGGALGLHRRERRPRHGTLP